jgi:hypothetical protein
MHEDGRAHLIFNDKSAIILHPGGECFTYFTPDGKKTRMLSKFAIKKADSILDKLILSIQFVNTFGDEPVVQREECFPDKVQLPYKIT